MAAYKQLVSHTRRRCTHMGTSSSLKLQPRDLGFCNSKSFIERLFCSSSPPDSQNNSIPVIKPVTYTMKSKLPPDNNEGIIIPDQSPPPAQRGRRPRDNIRPPPPPEPESEQPPIHIADSPSPSPPQSPTLTREDFRYVKDQPSISPVSYPSRVAPLPEDRVAGEEDGPNVDSTRPMPMPPKNIRVEEQKVVPFPTLIKLTKNKQKPLLDLQEAIREVKANAKSKFDETVEAHVNLGVDPKRGDQMVRGATTLPHGTGKAIKIAVFAEGAAAEEARAAGADIVGGDELIEEIRKGGGKLSFDKCISTPLYMPRLGKIARILGPRGLMPNPKLGSVTSDVAAAVRDAKRGRIDFKIDKTAIVHVGLGKVSFTEESLRENVGAFVNALLLAKPVGLKKTSKYAGYVNSFSLSSTMGPGFPVSVQSLSMAADHYNKLQLK